MRWFAAVLVSVAPFACGAPALLPSTEGGPESLADPVPSALCAAEPPGRSITASGEVSGIWSGEVTLNDQVTIASGASLEICPGTTMRPANGNAKIVVEGELLLSGSKSAMITVEEATWKGIEVHGKLSGGYIRMGAAPICLDGRNTSDIALVGALFDGCGQAFTLGNGGKFDHLVAIGGTSVGIAGGILSMIDSTIDLRHDGAPPDCAVWGGGGARLDHVRFTGCHCPIHVNRAPAGMRVTRSIFDGASVPIMIAGTHAEFSENNIPVGLPHVLDIGGEMTVSLANNYWGGGEPTITSGALEQFTGADAFAAAPFGDAGPR